MDAALSRPGSHPPRPGVIRGVGTGEMMISDREEDVLTAYSLGSCLGLALYDPELRLGGLLHAMLPVSSICPEKAERSPAMFTDTGVVALLQAMFERGARKSRLQVRVAGAASIQDQGGYFNIGNRNYAVLRKILWKNRILITSESVGGSYSRSLYLHVRDGRTVLRTVTSGEMEL